MASVKALGWTGPETARSKDSFSKLSMETAQWEEMRLRNRSAGEFGQCSHFGFQMCGKLLGVLSREVM